MVAPWREIAVDYCPPSEKILLSGKEIMKLGVKTVMTAAASEASNDKDIN